jgi:hypothetical protein
MFARFHRRGVGRRAGACLAIVAGALAWTAATASADTPFGGNPDGTVSTEASCGPTSCTLYWTGPGGTDLAPIPAGGGSGTITSVTLPAMPEPGTMQAVVLTSSLQATHDPGHPDYMCCQVKELSAPFTVPANQVATVPLSLHVSATEAVNLGMPGDTSTGDGVAISLLTPNASTPLRATENQADGLLYWAPALTAPTSSFGGASGDHLEYELMAGFNFGPASAGNGPTPGPPAPGAPSPGPAAKGGVKLSGTTFRPGGDGRTLSLGKASNPPTASTTQKLTVPTACASATGGKAKKPVVLGSGKTTVPSGRSAPIKLALNPTGRAALAKGHDLKATLTVVAANPQGESQTLTKSVTIKLAAKSKRPR